MRWSKALERRVCRRLAAGELIHVIGREPGMPRPDTVAKWAAEKPEFASALISARRAGGRAPGARGRVTGFCADVAEAVFQRLCGGESLTRIAADPLMPGHSTLARWRNRFPEFEQLVQLGMRVRAERMADDGWEMAMAATPDTAYLTHVRLAQLRWMTGVMAPKQFRPKLVEPVAPETTTVLLRTFGVKTHPVTGERKVVSYTPNPETGTVECDDLEKGTEGWIEEPPEPVHPGTAWGRGERDW
ncbi:MAG: hypothetical protein E7812_14315 [Phenylobacterium sp.]|nr:MAG: hypothetical protein E7812_14315 [Phenylobacterium sp.]